MLQKQPPKITITGNDNSDINNSSSIVLELPLLPSINRKTRYGPNGVYTSSEYALDQTRFVMLARAEANRAGWQVAGGDRYIIQFEFWFEDELKQDLDGPLKASLDCLQKAGVIHNDSRVVFCAINKKWCYPGESGATVTVTKTSATRRQHHYSYQSQSQQQQQVSNIA